MFPPPGEWLTLSSEPTLDWALSLKLTLCDSIFTSPPPAAATCGTLHQVIWISLQTSPCGSWAAVNLNFSLRWDFLTWLVLDVVLGAAFRRDLAQIHLLVEDLHLLDGSRHLKSRRYKRLWSNDSFKLPIMAWRTDKVLQWWREQSFIVQKKKKNDENMYQKNQTNKKPTGEV